jgi:hypothetical protein
MGFCYPDGEAVGSVAAGDAARRSGDSVHSAALHHDGGREQSKAAEDGMDLGETPGHWLFKLQKVSAQDP